MEVSDALPGADLIRAGLRDIAEGKDSIEALLVLVGAPRLRRIGFDVPDTLPLARFDAGLMEQALTNVLENVARHTPPGTAVSILGRIEDGTVRIEVSDAGPGIPIEARERVFAKFQRLADDSFGTGLGLAIARAATTAQGGTILVEDSPLGGARFIMLVPNQATGAPTGAS